METLLRLFGRVKTAVTPTEPPPPPQVDYTILARAQECLRERRKQCRASAVRAQAEAKKAYTDNGRTPAGRVLGLKFLGRAQYYVQWELRLVDMEIALQTQVDALESVGDTAQCVKALAHARDVLAARLGEMPDAEAVQDMQTELAESARDVQRIDRELARPARRAADELDDSEADAYFDALDQEAAQLAKTEPEPAPAPAPPVRQRRPPSPPAVAVVPPTKPRAVAEAILF